MYLYKINILYLYFIYVRTVLHHKHDVVQSTISMYYAAWYYCWYNLLVASTTTAT
jgi:hypothetical protein